MSADLTSPDLATDLPGLTLASPVLTAAGCGGTGKELAPFFDPARLGAFTTRTITLDPRPGTPSPRLVPTPAGVLADTGLQNPGLQGFLATELPWLAQHEVPTVVSVAAATLAEHAEIAGRVGASPGVLGVEVNLLGPDGAGVDAVEAGRVLHVVRREAPRGVAVLAKLPAGTVGTGQEDTARAAVDNGADALVVGHGYPGLLLDPDTLRPVLGGGAGLVSGPAVLPLALRAVWDLHAALPDVPLVGCGGVRTGLDALQMLAVGATAVQVGSAMLRDPGAPARVAAELAEELASRGLTNPTELAPTEGDCR